MKRCYVCRRENSENVLRCAYCHGTTFVMTDAVPDGHAHPQSPLMDRSMIRLILRVAALCVLIVSGAWAWQSVELKRFERGLESEFARLQQQRDAAFRWEETSRQTRLESAESEHHARLKDQRFLSGALARERHVAEWALRLKHDPSMAASVLETNQLKMERLGHDPAVSAQSALEQVATLAAPRGSRVEVKLHNGRFAVRVAFRMSTLTAQEAGAVTKHHTTESMRREIEELSGRVMKDLFDYCGSRGIQTLSVSCNHALRRTIHPPCATPREREELLRRAPVVMANLYRTSLSQDKARLVSNWREISIPKVVGMLAVERDGLKTLTISRTSPLGTPVDPAGQLEF